MITPLDYLTGSGPAAHPVVALTWGLSVISVAVSLIIAGLVWAGVVRRQAPGAMGVAVAVPVRREGDGVRWLTVGVGISSVALVVSLVWTVAVLAQVSNPPTKPALTIRVTGHQWWWQASYDPTDPARTFETANELHIPVGQPVRVELVSQDVIHSFWVPQLAGKTDTIPGRTNLAWIEADHPGVYFGQCTEYCGAQHAHMAFKVIAETPVRFAAWRAAQLQPASTDAPPADTAGQSLFVDRCGACHTVRGTQAGGRLGPDLTHLMSRTTLASATLGNTRASLAGWIANPQGVKPGTQMPTVYLSGAELSAVTEYLETLR